MRPHPVRRGTATVTGVIIDPAKAAQFARDLETLRRELEQLSKALDNEMKALGHTWRDRHFAEFRKHYEESRAVLAAFFKRAGLYAAYLHRKAQHFRNPPSARF